MSVTSNRGSIPAEVGVLIIRLLRESYIDLEAPMTDTSRFLVDGSTYLTQAESDVLDAWLKSVLEDEVG